MPAASPQELVAALLDAFEQSGYAAVLLSGVKSHPRTFTLLAPDGEQTSVWVYAWTLTPGGRATLPNEYRIQMTTVLPPLHLNPDGLTALVGYEQELGLFAGFDARRHRQFTQGSVSVQIDIRTVRQASRDGLAFHRKSNDEIVVGIRSDHFVTYAQHAEELHRYGPQRRTFDLLTQAAAREAIPEADLEHLARPRQRLVQTVSRLSRSANFAQQVMQAYGHRCAVTGTQLRLVDAAHILPVGAAGSIDDVRNGIALSPTYHRAFDRSLIYLDESYHMRLNPAKTAELEQLELVEGLTEFREALGEVRLPPHERQWPNRGLIRKANRLRGIQQSQA
jgi:putative restriction endonuclease